MTMATPHHRRNHQAVASLALVVGALAAAAAAITCTPTAAAAAAAASSSTSPAHSSKHSGGCGTGCTRCSSKSPKSKSFKGATTSTCLRCRGPNFTLVPAVDGTAACVCSPGFNGPACRACPAVGLGSCAAAGSFPQGVASGGPTGTTVVLWTRAYTPSPVTVSVVPAENEGEFVGAGGGGDCSGDASAPSLAFMASLGTSVADNDYTLQVQAEGLVPGQRYKYRFCALGGGGGGTVASPTGTFRTARRDTDVAAVSFAFSGDFTAQAFVGLQPLEPFYKDGFDVFRSMAQLGDALDFTVLGGDVIYSDDVVRAGPVRIPTAYTRPQKWAHYRANLAMPQLRAEHAAHAVLTHWDDHEFDNGFWPANSTARWLAGKAAFYDYSPMQPYGAAPGPGLFSVRSWGPNLDVIVLDEMSFRTQPVDEMKDKYKPDSTHPCYNPASRSLDRMPTAPQALRGKLYADLGSKDPWLQVPVAQACLDLLNAPGRTILGDAQLAALESALDASWARGARWRVVVSTNPVQEILVSPYGRFEGYPVERAKLLALLAKHPNTVTLATDVHATLAGVTSATWGSEPQPNNGQPSGSAPYEVAVGPVAAGTRREIWARYFKGGAEAVDTLVDVLYLAGAPLGGLGKQCANLDAFSFAVVTAGLDELTVQPMDRLGVALPNADGTPCGPIVVPAVC